MKPPEISFDRCTIEAKSLERDQVEHLAAPDIGFGFYEHLSNVGIQYSEGRSYSSSFMERHTKRTRLTYDYQRISPFNS
jgi:hypothetical protein